MKKDLKVKKLQVFLFILTFVINQKNQNNLEYSD